MNHEEWEILVSAYHDGELSPEEAARLEVHMADCAVCKEALAAYGRLGWTIHSLPRGEPSRDLWLRVQQGLPSRRGRPIWLRLLPLASALAMAAIGITLIVVLGTMSRGAATVQPEAQRQVVAATAPAAPTMAPAEAAPMPMLTTQGVLSSPPGLGGAAPASASACLGSPLALEVVSLSIRSDAQRNTPGLQGVLYDSQGAPVPGVTLVVSGTAGWVGSTTTADDGTFALELPGQGMYRVVVALAAGAAQDREGKAAGAVDSYTLPGGEVCLAPRDMRLPAATLGSQEVAILTLRLPER